jgi:type I restriction enzyme M protein
MQALHEAILIAFPTARILEVSTKSESQVGVALSAFNLKLKYLTESTTVESAFQSSKIFESSGPFRDLIHKAPWEAKRDPRIKESGELVAFELDDNRRFPIDQTSTFYDHIYLRALLDNSSLLEALTRYDTFTDIEFNKTQIGFQKGKSFNTQARSCALAVGLYLSGGLTAIERYLAKPLQLEKVQESAFTEQYLF